jgi:hypothetical protein
VPDRILRGCVVELIEKTLLRRVVPALLCSWAVYYKTRFCNFLPLLPSPPLLYFFLSLHSNLQYIVNIDNRYVNNLSFFRATRDINGLQKLHLYPFGICLFPANCELHLS